MDMTAPPFALFRPVVQNVRCIKLGLYCGIIGLKNKHIDNPKIRNTA
jgi:hypothetical protein